MKRGVLPLSILSYLLSASVPTISDARTTLCSAKFCHDKCQEMDIAGSYIFLDSQNQNCFCECLNAPDGPIKVNALGEAINKDQNDGEQ